MQNLYTVTPAATDVYSISENITTRPIKFAQQLIVGSERAALVDAGFGIDADLVTEIRKITSKPVICLLTHGDPDHTGGASLFDKVYMNPADDALMKAAFNPQFRLHAIDVASGHNTELVAHMQATMPQATRFTYQPVRDGMTFDLGGKTLQAVATPGHSQGSMCYVDVAHRTGFTGDSIATMVMSELYETRCAALTTWGESLAQLQALVGDDALLMSGHRIDAFPDYTLSTLMAAVNDIKAGNTADDQVITKMPNGNVSDNDQMHPRTHPIQHSPFVVMYNALNI